MGFTMDAKVLLLIALLAPVLMRRAFLHIGKAMRQVCGRLLIGRPHDLRAQAWAKLAERAVRNSKTDLVSEIPAKRPDSDDTGRQLGRELRPLWKASFSRFSYRPNFSPLFQRDPGLSDRCIASRAHAYAPPVGGKTQLLFETLDCPPATEGATVTHSSGRRSGV
jgi:hypothetical protein